MINNENKIKIIKDLLINKSQQVLNGDKELQASHFKKLLDLSLELLVSDPSNQEYKDLRALSLFSFVNTCLPPVNLATKQLELANQLSPHIVFIKNKLDIYKNLDNNNSTSNNNNNNIDNSIINNNNNNNNNIDKNSNNNNINNNNQKDKIKISNNFFKLSKEYQQNGDLQLGFHYLKMAYDNNENNNEINFNLSNLYEKQGKFQMSIDLLNKILKVDPFNWEVHYSLAILEQKVSLTENSIKRLKLIINSNSATENQKIKSNLLYLFYLNFIERFNSNQDCGVSIYEEHIKYSTRLFNKYQHTINGNEFSKQQLIKYSKQSPIKIAYMSNHFNQHPISYFIIGLLENHNRELFDIHIIQVVSGNHQDDEFTKRIKNYIFKDNKSSNCNSKWIKIQDSLIGEHPSIISESIRDKEISILVSLDMHTEKHAELLLHRLAPIQINYLGYPNTSGLDSSILQYRITDEYADPINSKQPFSEKLLRLDKTFLNFDASHLISLDSLYSNKCPFEENGYITFGCYNTLSKIQPTVLSLWKKIQDKLPTCRLLIKSPLFITESSCNSYLERLKNEFSFDISRIILSAYSFNTNDHYLSYSQMDISLDTFPYNGTTTSFDSLYMGVPFITLSGSTHVHNVGKSILSNISSISDLITNSHDQYVDTAINLANSQERLKYLRSNLRNLLLDSPLSNSKQFTLNLEAKYKEIHSDLNK